MAKYKQIFLGFKNGELETMIHAKSFDEAEVNDNLDCDYYVKIDSLDKNTLLEWLKDLK